jgi:hypothetical protein
MFSRRSAFSRTFTSSQQTITAAGQLVLAHSLGAVPLLMKAHFVAQNSVLGYTAGDVLAYAPTIDAYVGANRGMAVVVDATNLTVRFGSDANTFTIIRKDTGAAVVGTNSDWKIVFRAFA